MSAPEPQLLLQETFADMGHCGRSIGWDIDFRQIQAGPLRAQTTVLGVPDCIILGISLNRAFHQVGSPPKDRLTFGLPGSTLGEFNWCSRTVRGSELLNFNLETGFESVTSAEFHGQTISFSRERLQALASAVGICESVEDLVRDRATWHNAQTESLEARVSSFLNADVSYLPGFSEFINNQLGIEILGILTGEVHEGLLDTKTQRSRVLESALVILNDPNQLPVTVTELCMLVNTSVSTLGRAFKERFGITPKAYIRSRCLSAARDELARSDPGTRISKVANRWGFWHMSQFARDYQIMFDELPSKTLVRGSST